MPEPGDLIVTRQPLASLVAPGIRMDTLVLEGHVYHSISNAGSSLSSLSLLRWSVLIYSHAAGSNPDSDALQSDVFSRGFNFIYLHIIICLYHDNTYHV